MIFIEPPQNHLHLTYIKTKDRFHSDWLTVYSRPSTRLRLLLLILLLPLYRIDQLLQLALERFCFTPELTHIYSKRIVGKLICFFNQNGCSLWIWNPSN